jgi:hypothetical protein
MDQVTQILAALAAGQFAELGDTASQAIADADAALKALIKKRFDGHPKAEEILFDYVAEPETYERPLVKQLEATGAREDAEIVQAAGRRLKLADARVVHQATVEDIVSVIVAGVHVGTIDDHGSYTVGQAAGAVGRRMVIGRHIEAGDAASPRDRTLMTESLGQALI